MRKIPDPQNISDSRTGWFEIISVKTVRRLFYKFSLTKLPWHLFYYIPYGTHVLLSVIKIRNCQEMVRNSVFVYHPE